MQGKRSEKLKGSEANPRLSQDFSSSGQLSNYAEYFDVKYTQGESRYKGETTRREIVNFGNSQTIEARRHLILIHLQALQSLLIPIPVSPVNLA